MECGDSDERHLLGTDASSTIAKGGNNDAVLALRANNRIGGTTPAARNLLSGTGGFGVTAFGDAATGNVIQGNPIGTDIFGMRPLPNANGGVTLYVTDDNLVGGAAPATRNVIGASGNNGVLLFARANSDVVQGNLIGVDVTALGPPGNANWGVLVLGRGDNLYPLS